MVFIPLLLVSALRGPNVGTDTENYLYGFKLIKEAAFNEVFNVVRYEPGYVLLVKFISLLVDHEQVLLIVTSIIVLIGIFIFIYLNSPNVMLSVFLYLALYLYFFSFNGVRQAIAMSIVVSGFHYILERKFLKYLLIIILASLFHQTSIIFIIFYFFYGIKVNLKNVFFILGVFSIMFFYLESIIKFAVSFFDGLSYLLNTSLLSNSGGLLFPIINLAVLIFILYIKYQNKVEDRKLDLMIYIVLFGFLTSVLAIKIYILLRFVYYFFTYYIVAIPYAISFVKGKKEKITLISLVTIFGSIYMLVRLTNGWHNVTPYNFFNLIIP